MRPEQQRSTHGRGADRSSLGASSCNSQLPPRWTLNETSWNGTTEVDVGVVQPSTVDPSIVFAYSASMQWVQGTIVYAFAADAASGALLWRTPLPATAPASPQVFESASTVVFLGETSFIVIDRESGAVVADGHLEANRSIAVPGYHASGIFHQVKDALLFGIAGDQAIRNLTVVVLNLTSGGIDTWGTYVPSDGTATIGGLWGDVRKSSSPSATQEVLDSWTAVLWLANEFQYAPDTVCNAFVSVTFHANGSISTDYELAKAPKLHDAIPTTTTAAPSPPPTYCPIATASLNLGIMAIIWGTEGEASRAYLFDAATGKPFSAGPGYVDLGGTYTASSMMLFDFPDGYGVVLVVFTQEQGLYAYAAFNAPIWSYNDPAIIDDLVDYQDKQTFIIGGFEQPVVTKFNASTGLSLWSAPLPPRTDQPLTAWTQADDHVVLVAWAPYLTLLDAHTGRLLQQLNTDCNPLNGDLSTTQFGVRDGVVDGALYVGLEAQLARFDIKW